MFYFIRNKTIAHQQGKNHLKIAFIITFGVV